MQVSCFYRYSCTDKSTTSSKLGAVVAEVYLFVLDMNNHIHSVIIIYVAKRKRNRYFLITYSYQRWPNVID